MSRSSRRWCAVAAALLTVVLAACGSSDKSSDASGSATTTTKAPANPALKGNLDVFAAASLTEAFTDEKAALAGTAPDLTVKDTFAGSQALVTQIQNGAPADVFASADQKNMQKLVDHNLVDTPQTFARNKLQIAVQPGNP